MTAVMPAPTGHDDLLDRLAVTLHPAGAMIVALGLAPGADSQCRREALLVLAEHEEDLHTDGLTAAVHQAVAALAPGIPAAARNLAWQHVCEAAALISEWQDPSSAWLLAVATLPPGRSTQPTVDAAVDGLECRRDAALTALLGGAQ